VQGTIADGVVCVFPEVQHDADLLLQLTDGTAAKAGAALDPVGTMLNPSPASFGDVLRNLTAALKGCLSGA
jgi:zinc transport system substrate-binding protein